MGGTEVEFTFRQGDNVWGQKIVVDSDMPAHAALKMLAECANRTLIHIGKETGVFSR